MSITFWCPDAPTNLVTPYPDEPDFVVHESTLPELNLANGNASALLDLVQLPVDCAGTVPVEELPALQLRIERVLQTPVSRAALIEPSSVDGVPVHSDMQFAALLSDSSPRGGKGPRVISAGRTDDYLVDRATRLLELVKAARTEGYAISWG